jgi:hypothetical protein
MRKIKTYLKKTAKTIKIRRIRFDRKIQRGSNFKKKMIHNKINYN